MLRSVAVIAIALLMSAGAFAQPTAAPVTSAQTLPEFTAEQRWERAASQATFAFVAFMALGKQAGKSVDDTGKALFAIFGPGWSKNIGPVEIASGLRRNLLLWPKAEVDVLELTPAVSRVRFNRPWTDYFGDTGEAIGVKMEEFERTLEVFQRMVAEERGMTLDAQRDGSHITYTFKKK